MNDIELLESLIRREESALDELKEKYGAYCRYIAQQILGSPEDAEEVENDALLKAWRSLPAAKITSLRSYLGMLARNLAIDKRRADPSRRLPEDAFLTGLDELAEVLPDGAEDKVVSEIELKDLMTHFLSELTAKNRRIFLKRYWFSCSVREIAEEMHMSESSIKMRLKRSREQLQMLMEWEVGRK